MLRIVVPLGGEGKSFIDHGYPFPKPLIEIKGRPMIEVVIHNLQPSEPHEFIFICRQEHINKYALEDVLKLISPTCQVVAMPYSTAGALCSVLLAMEYFTDNSELLIANGDQYIDVPVDDFLKEARQENVDGCIMTFPSTHPKWSFAKVEGGEVVAVAEKKPISNQATVGLYYFRHSKDFLAGAERMILKNATLGGQFYVCPVYNELILAGKRITNFAISRQEMHSLGTPDDLETFRAEKANSLVW